MIDQARVGLTCLATDEMFSSGGRELQAGQRFIAEGSENDKYRDACRRANLTFRPVVIETFGAIG